MHDPYMFDLIQRPSQLGSEKLLKAKKLSRDFIKTNIIMSH